MTARFCKEVLVVSAAEFAKRGILTLDDRRVPCPEKAMDGSDWCRWHHQGPSVAPEKPG